MSNVPGTIARHAIITDACRVNRTDEGAIDEALARLRAEFLECARVWQTDKGAQFHAVLTLERARDRELASFAARLKETGAPRQAALTSLIERVREFVDKHARNGSKTGRDDYTKLVPLSDFEPLRIAFDEFARFNKPAPLTPDAAVNP